MIMMIHNGYSCFLDTYVPGRTEQHIDEVHSYRLLSFSFEAVTSAQKKKTLLLCGTWVAMFPFILIFLISMLQDAKTNIKLAYGFSGKADTDDCFRFTKGQIYR